MPTDQQALLALDEIEQVIRRTARISMLAGCDEIPPGGMPGVLHCEDYRQIRPRLDTALPMIDRIPMYGARIATAIRFLMQMADVQCKATPREG